MSLFLELRIVLVAEGRWQIGAEHPNGHVVLVPIAFRTFEEAHRAVCEWQLEETLSRWPM